MSGFRLLVCVDNSPAALAAARLALDLVQKHGGAVRAVSVVEDSEAARLLNRGRRRSSSVSARLKQGGRAVLDRVESMGERRDLSVETEILEGTALDRIMTDARRWNPDFILIGRSGRSGPGSPMLGSLAMQVVEFAEWPVVVVPETKTS